MGIDFMDCLWMFIAGSVERAINGQDPDIRRLSIEPNIIKADLVLSKM